MASITSTDRRKPFIVAAMKAKLGANTRITLVEFDKDTNTFTGNAPSLDQRVSVLASEIPGLPQVEKVVLVPRFNNDADVKAGIIALLTEKATKRAAKTNIRAAWLRNGMDVGSDYELLHNCGTTNSFLAEHLGFSLAKTMTLLNKMIEAGQLFGMKLTWGMTVLPQDADLRAALVTTMMNNPHP